MDYNWNAPKIEMGDASNVKRKHSLFLLNLSLAPRDHEHWRKTVTLKKRYQQISIEMSWKSLKRERRVKSQRKITETECKRPTATAKAAPKSFSFVISVDYRWMSCVELMMTKSSEVKSNHKVTSVNYENYLAHTKCAASPCLSGFRNNNSIDEWN